MNNLEPAFLFGSVFLVVGIIMYFFPPKKINMIYGYKTERAMQSQQNWDLAQKYSSKIMMFLGGLLALFSLLLNLFYWNKTASTITSFVLIGSTIIAIFYLVERKLKKQ